MLTVKEIYLSELEEKKSRFIGIILPYSSFDERLSLLRKEYPKANHFVTAFRYLNDQDQLLEGSRDDGEPSGTSGPPILKVLQGKCLINVGAIVIRYFGGTKLGKGGLSRAYSSVIKQTIEQAALFPWYKTTKARVEISFKNLKNFESNCEKFHVAITARLYNDNGASFEIEGAKENIELVTNNSN